jgi:hypothetical protein
VDHLPRLALIAPFPDSAVGLVQAGHDGEERLVRNVLEWQSTETSSFLDRGTEIEVELEVWKDATFIGIGHDRPIVLRGLLCCGRQRGLLGSLAEADVWIPPWTYALHQILLFISGGCAGCRDILTGWRAEESAIRLLLEIRHLRHMSFGSFLSPRLGGSRRTNLVLDDFGDLGGFAILR